MQVRAPEEGDGQETETDWSLRLPAPPAAIIACMAVLPTSATAADTVLPSTLAQAGARSTQKASSATGAVKRMALEQASRNHSA